MGLKGYRLWVMGQLDSNLHRPTDDARRPRHLRRRHRGSSLTPGGVPLD
jgi:hypothetical protein